MIIKVDVEIPGCYIPTQSPMEVPVTLLWSFMENQ